MPSTLPAAIPPYPSLEVRWFLDGEPEAHPELPDWFLHSRPVGRHGHIAEPRWQGRLNDEPDLYLLLQGSDDMGVKWREGALQLKGRVANLGTEVFAGRHYGHVQRWLKWSYGELPDAYRRLFAPEADLHCVAVHKTRLLRHMQINTFSQHQSALSQARSIPCRANASADSGHCEKRKQRAKRDTPWKRANVRKQAAKTSSR